MTSGPISRMDANLGPFRQWIAGRMSFSAHSLRQKLLLGTGAALVCTLFLAASLIGRSINDYRRASQDLRALESYRLILAAANLLSAERGPSNSLLGDYGAASDVLHRRLAMFRARSDAILDQLSAPSASASSGERVPENLLAPVRAQLQTGRQDVDRVTAIPFKNRSLHDVQSAIDSMIAVVDLFQSVVVWKASALIASSPALAEPVMTGRIFGELREYAGRIGSQIMAPIAVRQRLPLKNLIDSNRTRGRLLELWNLAGDQAVASRGDPRVLIAMREADRAFFGKGLGLLDMLIAEGRVSGNYTMTTDEFTVRFVETLKPIETLRGVSLDAAIERFTEARNGALLILGATVATTLIILSVLAGLVIAAQRFVFGPLMRACEAVIMLAEDRPGAFRSERPHGTEMRRLFDAIGVLDDSLAERASLTRQLKQQAETDGLTGLMNRRALDMIGESHTSSEMTADGVCLILMDIDHFKSINDRFGHLEGDRVLRESVKLIHPVSGPNDMFARFGGEEFVIVIPGCDLAGAIAQAERIRTVLETSRIVLSDGTPVKVTASFGVARGNLGQLAWRRLIEAADRALYRAKFEGRNRVRHTGPSPGPSLVPEMPDAPMSDVSPPKAATKA